MTTYGLNNSITQRMSPEDEEKLEQLLSEGMSMSRALQKIAMDIEQRWIEATS